MRILVAGFGNLLLGDDGFGVLLLRQLQVTANLPAGIHFLDAGIGGISLVQDLLAGYDALVILDAVEGVTPGTVHVREAEVAAVDDLSAAARRDCFADIHYAEPNRALLLARAMGVLPAKVYIVGCVPGAIELGEALTPVVDAALPRALEAAVGLLRELGTEPVGREPRSERAQRGS